VRKSDFLAELTDVMSDGVAQDLWLLSLGIDNNPWGQYQPVPYMTRFLLHFILFKPSLSSTWCSCWLVSWPQHKPAKKLLELS